MVSIDKNELEDPHSMLTWSGIGINPNIFAVLSMRDQYLVTMKSVVAPIDLDRAFQNRSISLSRVMRYSNRTKALK